MEALIHKIVGSTGITGEQAKKAVEIVNEELKSKFPSFLHGEIDNVINGGRFGNSFRSKAEDLRDKAGDLAKEAGHKAEGVISDIKEKLGELFNGNKTSGNGK